MTNNKLSAKEVIALLPESVKPSAELVGKWVWITFTENPGMELRLKLKEIGFRYNQERKCWQHPCGIFRWHSPRNPKNKYAVTPVSEVI